jgi:hypothetical protein
MRRGVNACWIIRAAVTLLLSAGLTLANASASAGPSQGEENRVQSPKLKTERSLRDANNFASSSVNLLSRSPGWPEQGDFSFAAVAGQTNSVSLRVIGLPGFQPLRTTGGVAHWPSAAEFSSTRASEPEDRIGGIDSGHALLLLIHVIAAAGIAASRKGIDRRLF